MQVEYIRYPHDGSYDHWFAVSGDNIRRGVTCMSVWLVPGTYDNDGVAYDWAIEAYHNMGW